MIDMKRKESKETDDRGAVVILVIWALLIGLLLGPAIDKQLDVWDAQDAAFQSMLVAK